MPNLMLGNHDLVRFGDLLERGNFNPADYWQRHKAAFSFLAARSGPITLYYGEEFGDEVPGFASQVGATVRPRGSVTITWPAATARFPVSPASCRAASRAS
jgi:hypothetical protein